MAVNLLRGRKRLFRVADACIQCGLHFSGQNINSKNKHITYLLTYAAVFDHVKSNGDNVFFVSLMILYEVF